MSLQRDGARFAVRLIDAARTRSIDLEALLDSGASHTTLDASIAEAMGPLTDRQMAMRGAVIGQRSSIVLRPFVLLFLGGPTVRLHFNSALAMPDMQRMAGTEMLLARDVMRHATVTYCGTSGRVELRFVGASN